MLYNPVLLSRFIVCDNAGCTLITGGPTHEPLRLLRNTIRAMCLSNKVHTIPFLFSTRQYSLAIGCSCCPVRTGTQRDGFGAITVEVRRRMLSPNDLNNATFARIRSTPIATDNKYYVIMCRVFVWFMRGDSRHSTLPTHMWIIIKHMVCSRRCGE